MISANVFTPFVLAAIGLVWWSWLRRAFGRPVRVPFVGWPPWVGNALLVAVVVYGIARNIPVPAMRALAP